MMKSEAVMSRALRWLCYAKMRGLYPAGIPAPVLKRFEKEWKLLREYGKAESLYAFHALAEEAARSGIPFNLRGAGNASLMVFLLHDSAVNPLPAHYYCPACGHFEEIRHTYFGLDAPEPACPCCGKKMRSDGFSLPPEMAWREGKGADLSEFSTLFSAAEIFPVLKRLYGKRVKQLAEQVVDEPDCVRYLSGHPRREGTRFILDEFETVYRFVILPEGHSADDFPELTVKCGRKKAVYAPLEELEQRGIRHLTFVRWHGYPLGGHASMSLRGIKPMPDLIESLKDRITLSDLLEAREVLFWGGEYKNRLAWQKMQAAPPASYQELTEMLCLMHSSWTERTDKLKDTAFASREALFHLLCRAGLPEKDAASVTEFIQTGRASNPKHRTEWLRLLAEYPMLERIRKDAENCRYLWPQAAVLPTVMDAIACAGRKTI